MRRASCAPWWLTSFGIAAPTGTAAMRFHVELDEGVDVPLDPGELQVIRVNEALEELGEIDERLVRVVEMRYFAA
jgi:hypothetical protein